MKEEWKDICGYEGLYQVSGLGRVKSLPKKIEFKDGRKPVFKGERILNCSINATGRRVVTLYKDKSSKKIYVSHLVADAFLGHQLFSGWKGRMKLVVDHINNDPSDDRVENLQVIPTRTNTSKDKKGGLSKYTGVTWDKSRNRWYARICLNGKKLHLGSFIHEIDAHHAYQKKLKEYSDQASIQG